MNNKYDPTHWGATSRGKQKKTTPKLRLLNELMAHVNSVVFSLKPRYIDSSFLQNEGRAYAIHFIDETIAGYEVAGWQETEAKDTFYDLCKRHLEDINQNHRLALKTKELLNMEINNGWT